MTGERLTLLTEVVEGIWIEMVTPGGWSDVLEIDILSSVAIVLAGKVGFYMAMENL